MRGAYASHDFDQFFRCSTLNRVINRRIYLQGLRVQRYVTKRSGDVSAHTVQKELNTLKHLLGLAVDWDIIPYSPAHKVKTPRVPAGRVRYLTAH